MSFRDPEYLKNWRVLFKKQIHISADMYTSLVRVKASQFHAKMLHGGIKIHFAGTTNDSLSKSATYSLQISQEGVQISRDILLPLNQFKAQSDSLMSMGHLLCEDSKIKMYEPNFTSDSLRIILPFDKGHDRVLQYKIQPLYH